MLGVIMTRKRKKTETEDAHDDEDCPRDDYG